jgi:hypothetical protein
MHELAAAAGDTATALQPQVAMEGGGCPWGRAACYRPTWQVAISNHGWQMPLYLGG